jgi:hypothetical protein
VLVAGIIVDVDGDAAQGGDFGAQGGEGRVVLSAEDCVNLCLGMGWKLPVGNRCMCRLPFAFVGFRHDCE